MPTLTITVTRLPPRGNRIDGTLSLPTCPYWQIKTLENAGYAIPAGTYPLRLTYSPKYKKPLPLIDKVPGRTGIRIHTGNRPEHSKGCILVSPGPKAAIINLLRQYGNEAVQIKITERYDYHKSQKGR